MDDGVKSMLKVSFKNYDENLENIYKFMYPLWHEVYKEIIPEKQIDFLLHKYFDVENIRTYIKDNYIYEKIILDENVVGIICYKLFDNYVYLDKIYLLKSYRNLGISKFVYHHLLSFKNRIRLNVNQKNSAVNSYLKNGFKIIKEESYDLGQDMINIDYIMELEKE